MFMDGKTIRKSWTFYKYILLGLMLVKLKHGKTGIHC